MTFHCTTVTNITFTSDRRKRKKHSMLPAPKFDSKKLLQIRRDKKELTLRKLKCPKEMIRREKAYEELKETVNYNELNKDLSLIRNQYFGERKELQVKLKETFQETFQLKHRLHAETIMFDEMLRLSTGFHSLHVCKDEHSKIPPQGEKEARAVLTSFFSRVKQLSGACARVEHKRDMSAKNYTRLLLMSERKKNQLECLYQVRGKRLGSNVMRFGIKLLQKILAQVTNQSTKYLSKETATPPKVWRKKTKRFPQVQVKLEATRQHLRVYVLKKEEELAERQKQSNELKVKTQELQQKHDKSKTTADASTKQLHCYQAAIATRDKLRNSIERLKSDNLKFTIDLVELKNSLKNKEHSPNEYGHLFIEAKRLRTQIQEVSAMRKSREMTHESVLFTIRLRTGLLLKEEQKSASFKNLQEKIHSACAKRTNELLKKRKICHKLKYITKQKEHINMQMMQA